MFATLASMFAFVIFSFIPLTYCFLFEPFRSSKSNNLLPPGPKSWFILGNLPQFIKAKSKAAWLYETLNEFNSGIACIRLGNVHVIPISCPKIALEIVKHQDALFASRPKTASSRLFSRNYLSAVFSPHGHQWQKMRKMLTSEYLSPARHKWFHEKRMSEANNLVKWIYTLQEKDHNTLINLRTITRHYGVNVTRKMIFGTRYFGAAMPDGGPGAAEIEHVKAIWQSLEHSFSFAISDYFPILASLDLDGQLKHAKEAYEILNKYHDPIIDERVRKWRNGDHVGKMEDFLDVMISLEDSCGKPLLSIEEIKAQIIEIFMASADNPANCIEWTMAEFISQPKLLRKAVDEMDKVVGKERLVEESDIPNLHFLKACVKESFRLHPISRFIPTHLAMDDTTVAGYFIPKGSHIHLSRSGVGRSAKVWDDPLVFNPERHMSDASSSSSSQVLTERNMRFISFGLGRRGCVAGNLGSLMTMMLLARLVQGFDWKVEGKLNLKEFGGGDLSLVKPLLANATPRLPQQLYESV